MPTNNEDIRWEQRFANYRKALKKLTAAVEYVTEELENEMEFGSLISNYNIQVGSYGSTIKVDITEYLPDEITSVQSENIGGSKSEPITVNSSYELLQNYIETENCPQIAWNYSSNILTIFFANNSGDDK